MLTILLIILILFLIFGGFGYSDGRVILWILAAVVLVILLTRL